MRIAVLALLAALAAGPVSSPFSTQTPDAARQTDRTSESWQIQEPDFDKQLQQQAETDKAWRTASHGYMQMEKITYRSRVGDLDIPAFVFLPLKPRGSRGHPALVWVHENIRGHLYEHYIPYIREATGRGYVVIAPEYRGSIGYGRAFYDAIDYGGSEVDDVTTAVDVLKNRYAMVDSSRIGIIGWSHGGMITLLGILRNPSLFRPAVAMVPLTTRFHRLAGRGAGRRNQPMVRKNRTAGLPTVAADGNRKRPPLFLVANLRPPLN